MHLTSLYLFSLFLGCVGCCDVTWYMIPYPFWSCCKNAKRMKHGSSSYRPRVVCAACRQRHDIPCYAKTFKYGEERDVETEQRSSEHYRFGFVELGRGFGIILTTSQAESIESMFQFGPATLHSSSSVLPLTRMLIRQLTLTNNRTT